MQRLAFVLSGHMRSYRNTLASYHTLIKNLSTTYECDTFIYTWDQIEPKTPTWYDNSHVVSHTITKTDVLDAYNPKLYIIATQNIDNDKQILYNQSYKGLVYAEYAKFMANCLKIEYEQKNNFVYDVVICSRPDILYYSTFPQEELKINKVWMCAVHHNKAAGDILLFGGSKEIDKVRDYYHFYQYRLDNEQHQNNETYFYKYLNDEKINYSYSSYTMPIHWKIYRSWWKSDEDNLECQLDPLTWSRKHAMGI